MNVYARNEMVGEWHSQVAAAHDATARWGGLRRVQTILRVRAPLRPAPEASRRLLLRPRGLSLFTWSQVCVVEMSCPKPYSPSTCLSTKSRGGSRRGRKVEGRCLILSPAHCPGETENRRSQVSASFSFLGGGSLLYVHCFARKFTCKGGVIWETRKRRFESKENVKTTIYFSTGMSGRQ